MTDLTSRLPCAVGSASRIEKELGGGGMSYLRLSELGRAHDMVGDMDSALAAYERAARAPHASRILGSMNEPHPCQARGRVV